MMQVRCQRCGWVFTLSREAIGFAVAEAQASEAEYYQEPCPKCRNEIKIRVRELRKRLPADYTLPVLPPKPSPVHVAKGEEPKPAASPPAAVLAPEPEPKTPSKPEAEAAAEPKAASKPKAAAKPKAASRQSSKK